MLCRVRFKVPRGAKVEIEDLVRGHIEWDVQVRPIGLPPPPLPPPLTLQLNPRAAGHCRRFCAAAVRWDARLQLLRCGAISSAAPPPRTNTMRARLSMTQVDDAQMEVSTVIRAEEHLTNTVRQVLILKALGYTPPQYAHLALVLGEDRSKLSKRHGATS
ncbi:MAG: hypothetical protein SGPRY_006863, partial [Prymnesium sp.]